jgi:ATP-dependent exoDNAse (exonuclease V) alpha subunit
MAAVGRSAGVSLHNYAGTGKTTLARHLAESVDGDVVYAAYTGKAACVMRAKGCEDASTIHRLIYAVREVFFCAAHAWEQPDPGRCPTCDELLKAKLRFAIDYDSRARTASLIVIDEASMVDEVVGRDLMSFGVPILVIYDPAQLPPISGAGFFTMDAPDVTLTEIHRQARDNPVIHLATTVREGGRLQVGDYGTSRVTANFASVNRLAADQVLVGRNVTRRANNASIRKLLGMNGGLPVEDDKLVCLRNEHDNGLLNGGIWTVDRLIETASDGAISMKISPEGEGDPITVMTHALFFEGRANELSYARREFSEFDFGYALTVHKAQGSEWNRVIVIDESICFRADAVRWLYTGITRASEQITVITR